MGSHAAKARARLFPGEEQIKVQFKEDEEACQRQQPGAAGVQSN
jgi:hypothetical protein